jgi:hypothetical protein
LGANELIAIFRNSEKRTSTLTLSKYYKVGTQFGTQKGAERAIEAVDAVHAVANFLWKFSGY